MSPGQTGNKKKLSTSGHNTFSVRDTERTSHSKRPWKMTTAKLCLWTSAFALRSAVGFKKGSGLPRRTHSCCVILQWQNIKFCIYLSIIPKLVHQLQFFSANLPWQQLESSVHFNSCFQFFVHQCHLPWGTIRGFEMALKQPRFAAMILQFHLNRSTNPRPGTVRISEDLGNDYGKYVKKQRVTCLFLTPPKNIKNRRPKQQNLPSSLLLVTSTFPQA